jgi:quinol monooxygenase YgiN
MDLVLSKSGPLVRIAELEIDGNHLSAYTELLAEEIEASVATEPGVLMLYALSVKDDPTHIRIVEVYADQVAYEAHLGAPHFLRYKVSTAAMVRSLRLVETDPILLRAKQGQ